VRPRLGDVRMFGPQEPPLILGCERHDYLLVDGITDRATVPCAAAYRCHMSM
jgi:hypothetical protein